MKNTLLYIVLTTLLIQLSVGHLQSQEFDGYCLYNPLNNRTTYLIDKEGNIAHSWNCNVNCNYAVLLKENGNIMRGGVYNNNRINGAAVGGMVQEYDPDGNIVWQFIYSDQDHVMHHDITLMPNGNVLLTAWEVKSRAELLEKGYTGSANFRYVTHFIEVEKDGFDGKIVWEWHLWDHMVQDVDSTLDNYGIISENPQLIDINISTSGRGSNGDWFHINGVNYDPRLDQIVFSSRYLSEIFVIDHSVNTEEAKGHTGGNAGMGGDLLYRWGNPGNYDTPGNRNIPGPCHDARFINNNGGPNDGYIQFFNNAGGPGAGSTVDAIKTPLNGYNYDRVPGEAFEPLSPSWTHNTRDPASGQSASNRMPDGNTFVCLSGKYLYEVDSVDNVVWQYATGTAKAFRYTCDHQGIRALLNNPCDVSTSRDEFITTEMIVSPNPSKDVFQVSGVDFNLTVREIKVFDMTGKEVYRCIDQQQIDLSNQSSGIYIAAISFSNAPPQTLKLSVVD
jgi:hypothetical protein